MPIVIPISGVIARNELEEESNVTPKTLEKSLKDANGEDVLITINSPGGSVWAGLEMFSQIVNYPGNVETRIVSLAASMGSIIALAGKKRSAERTAMYFVHNAQGIGFGDYRELAKESKWLEDISVLMAGVYSEFLNITLDEARTLMDNDSQFFGPKLQDLGFELVDSENNVDESTARVTAKKRISEMGSKLQNEDYMEDLEKAVACISDEKSSFNKFTENKMSLDKNAKIQNSTANKIKTTPATGGTNNIQEDVNMTLDELKTQYPDLCAQIEQAGVDKEKRRVSAHMKLGKATNSMDLAQKFIEEGRSTMDEDVNAEYLTAGMNKTDLDNRQTDNPDTGQQPTETPDAHLDAFEAGMTGGADLYLDDVEDK